MTVPKQHADAIRDALGASEASAAQRLKILDVERMLTTPPRRSRGWSSRSWRAGA
jgi:hypothetical protein